jgi:hypothetical protein
MEESMINLQELYDTPKEQRADWVNTVPTYIIVEWLLELHELKTRTKSYGKKYRQKQQMLVKAAMEHLSPDELQEIMRRAQEKADGL